MGIRPIHPPIGDVGAPRVVADWGLHLVDVNLGMGSLVDIVRQQSEVWMVSRR
jgi:hypothetical protein